ncbi:flagellar assembly protein FliW [Dermatophilus congolensis]|uniref:flagellar assembly protein FliW n=1 Tax=Dermatophilus congolensis TaxID=1863 RepID=UPI001AAFBF4E|nr:flagellar assembly protein FliW [Dermatophilus congolensis]MBO3143440.1 flagellar assembly protein FliW [Dermatophilus congolensis]MBO3152430.1 flagellar assembly protein FliW [Dermatophilus congolensis]MBO3160558.1 flagellar assembly protein FliW [Dermatophilus congolensis]MBO3163717.1 flagellar assembly protein FliW [Dermatophilus congolensis]MBO3177263.1 flagellar assembly protein FliW [Dermatophilus congolensis]
MTTTTDVNTSVDITLDAGLVGFPLAQHFRLSEAEGGLYEMECLDIPDMAFVVIAPNPFFPDYSPVIDPSTAARLGIDSPKEALVFLVVNLGSENEGPAANLMAPLIVNTKTRKAMQVVLDGQNLPLRASLPVS